VRIDLKYDEGLFNCGLGVQRPSRPHDFALARFRGSTSSMNRHAGENLMQAYPKRHWQSPAGTTKSFLGALMRPGR
jgi:hypothetical protein